MELPKSSYAGFWLRLWAYLTDLLVLNAFRGALGLNNFFIQMGLLLLYFILMTKFTNGQTLGKMLFGLRVYVPGEEKLSWMTVLFREGIGRFIVEALPITWGLYLVTAFTPEKQGIADLFTDTYVVKEDYLTLFQLESSSL